MQKRNAGDKHLHTRVPTRRAAWERQSPGTPGRGLQCGRVGVWVCRCVGVCVCVVVVVGGCRCVNTGSGVPLSTLRAWRVRMQLQPVDAADTVNYDHPPLRQPVTQCWARGPGRCLRCCHDLHSLHECWQRAIASAATAPHTSATPNAGTTGNITAASACPSGNRVCMGDCVGGGCRWCS
jgi:hypothetical protein